MHGISDAFDTHSAYLVQSEETSLNSFLIESSSMSDEKIAMVERLVGRQEFLTVPSFKTKAVQSLTTECCRLGRLHS